VIIPLLGFLLTLATQFAMLLIGSAVLLGNGLSAASLWESASLVRMPLLLLYHLITGHVLWAAPIYAWLLLVSAWSRRAPLLWAVLPPAAIVAVEKIAFNTSYFRALLFDRFMGGGQAAIMPRGGMPTDPGTQLTP